MEQEPGPITDEELLYRRVPVSMNLYDPATNTLSQLAFSPNKERDATGLSISRAKFKSIKEAAQGQPGKSYYVAVLRTGELRAVGIAVKSQPHVIGGYDPSHAELPDLNAANRKSDLTLERQKMLARELCLGVEGPFTTPVLPT